jgi:hypothetical protein
MKRKETRAKLEHMYHLARSEGQYNDEYHKGQLDAAGPSK